MWRVYVLRMLCLVVVQLAWCSLYQYHLSGEFQLGYRIKVSLQKGGIVLGFDAAIGVNMD